MSVPQNPFIAEQFHVFKYDVSGGDSGAIATHVIGKLPPTFTITQAWLDVQTTFTSAADSATIGLGYTGSVSAFDAPIAIDNGGNPWDAAAPRVSDGAADGLVANFVVIGASTVNVVAVVAVQALTAGKLLLCVKGYVAR